jgi:hypothetical protein
MEPVENIKEKIDSKKSLEEFKIHAKSIADELIEDIKSGRTDEVNKKLKKFSPEELDIVMKETQPFKSIGTASREKYVVASVNNLKEEYYKKLLTTSMVGFLYQMCSEYTVQEDDLSQKINEEDFMEEVVEDTNFTLSYDKVYNEELVRSFKENFPEEEVPVKFKEIEERLEVDDLTNISITASKLVENSKEKKYVLNKTKLFDHVQQKVEDQSEEERKIITRFLNTMFKYNPNEHLEKSYDETKDVQSVDPERKPIQPESEDAVESVVYSNIPPNDTFSRFTSFYEVNYEKLREATHNLYNVKPDLEYAMIVYDTFNDYKDVEKFIHKYTTDSKFSFLTFGLNTWTFLGPFDKNKERIKFYNKNNKILESMLEQQEKDAILGEQLIKDRIKKKKVKNTKYYGPDDPNFAIYKKENPSILESEYGIKVTDTEDGGITVEEEVEVGEDGTPVDEDGTPLNAVEFDVHSINAKTGKMVTKKMYSKAADAPNK